MMMLSENTVQSHICVTVTLSTEEPYCLSSVFIVLPQISQAGGGGQEIDGQGYTIDSNDWISGPSQTQIQLKRF